MIRKYIMKVIETLNPVLLLAPIIPIVYCFGFVHDLEIGYELYFKSLLIVIPVLALDYFEERCKHLITFILLSAFTFAVTLGLAYLLGPVLVGNNVMLGLPLILGLECLALFIFHFKARLTYAQQLQDEGRITKSEVKGGIFSKPSKLSFILFGVYYFIAMGFMSRTVCNEIFISAVIYLFIWIVHEYISSTEDYLKLHNDVAGIPKKRVYGIGAGMLGIFMLILLILVVPSIALMNQRPYYDLTQVLDNEVEYQPEMSAQENFDTQSDDMSIYEQMAEEVEPFEWPAWVKFLSKCFVGAILLIVAFLALKGIKQIFDTFKMSFEENGDIVESLEDEDQDELISTSISTKGLEPEVKKIRRLYKKTIRKARKEKPLAYETPHEMEEKAGLLNNPEMIKLHKEYEAVRYNSNN